MLERQQENPAPIVRTIRLRPRVRLYPVAQEREHLDARTNLAQRKNKSSS
jgi:hypothetical protein